jgi:hypothetical protein
VDLQPLVVAKTSAGERLVKLGPVLAGLASGDALTVPGVNGARVFFRIDATAGGADLVIYLVGGSRSNEGSI